MTRSKRGIAALLLVCMVGFASCGDDDDGATSTEAEQSGEARDGEQPSGDVDRYCDAVFKIETIEEPEVDFESLSPDEQKKLAQEFAREKIRPLADDIVESAPEEVADDIEVLDEAVTKVEETGDFEGAFETPEVEEASDRVHEFDLENCGWNSTDVKGIDYAYEGIPRSLEAGTHSFEFANAGKEVHMLGIVRKKDDTTESWDELLELPQEEAQAKTEFLGEASGPPGEDEYLVVDLEPGEYLAVCFIPTGSTPDNEDADGPPHFVKGMRTEFTVE